MNKYFKMKNKYVLLSLFLCQSVLAQTTGVLSGRIFDIQSQLPLEGASIILEGSVFGTVTDSEGYFKLQNIPSQSYNITASYLGYESETQFNVIVKSIGNIPLLFELVEVSENLDEVVLVRSPFKNKRAYNKLISLCSKI